MEKLDQKNHFSFKAMVILTFVCVLISVFAVVSIVQAANQNGSSCSSNSDCNSGKCFYGTCFAKPFDACRTSFDCAGSRDKVMGCFSGQCQGRHGYPCGNDRNDPICASGFHCDISGTLGYHYCEGDHEEEPPQPYCGDGQVNQSWEQCDGNSPQACTTSNGYAGTKSCANCFWGSCQTNQYCGDGIKNGNEQCDGSAGVPAGYTCTAACTLLQNPPQPYCGDGQVNQSWEQCDGNSPQACTTSNGYAGTKSCANCFWGSCQTNQYCGDGIKNGNEQCDGSAGVPANYTCTIQCILEGRQNPNLTITKSVDKTSANPGDEIVYTLNYQNTGNAVANNVVVSDPFTNLNQNYLTFISANPSPLSGADTWNIGTLSAGQSGQITIRARISNDVPNGYTQIQNRASIDSNETNLQYSNYVSTWVYRGSESISLSINKLVRNISDGTSFYSSIDANHGEEVEFSLEIRNTSNNIARNVRVWDNLPSRLEYISGSTLVDGSYRSDGIIGSGINIGDISANGSKLVKFKARVEDYSYYGTAVLTNYGYTAADNYQTIYDTATVRVEYEDQGSPNLNIDKLVRNITRGYGYWTTSVYAQPNNEIEFLIKVNSVGNQTAENLRIRDSLPSKLNYISDSTTLDGSYRSDGLLSSDGIYAGNLAVGNYREIKFRARVASVDNFSAGTTTLTNYGYARADEVSQISDTAQVLVQKEQEQSTRAISINKLGRNISQGYTTWFDSFIASPSEQVEFSIQVTNIGNTNLSNVKVWDNLPANLSLISNSTTIDGVSWGGDVNGAGLNLGSLGQGQARTVKFTATIDASASFGAGSFTLINTAYAVADNVSQISDPASVIITKPGEVKGEEFVPTGANTIGLGFLAVISAFIALFVYCRTREEKLLEVLNNNKSNKLVKSFIRFYFRIKFFITITKLRFKQFYW